MESNRRVAIGAEGGGVAALRSVALLRCASWLACCRALLVACTPASVVKPHDPIPPEPPIVEPPNEEDEGWKADNRLGTATGHANAAPAMLGAVQSCSAHGGWRCRACSSRAAVCLRELRASTRRARGRRGADAGPKPDPTPAARMRHSA